MDIYLRACLDDSHPTKVPRACRIAWGPPRAEQQTKLRFPDEDLRQPYVTWPQNLVVAPMHQGVNISESRSSPRLLKTVCAPLIVGQSTVMCSRSFFIKKCEEVPVLSGSCCADKTAKSFQRSESKEFCDFPMCGGSLACLMGMFACARREPDCSFFAKAALDSRRTSELAQIRLLLRGWLGD